MRVIKINAFIFFVFERLLSKGSRKHFSVFLIGSLHASFQTSCWKLACEERKIALKHSHFVLGFSRISRFSQASPRVSITL